MPWPRDVPPQDHGRDLPEMLGQLQQGSRSVAVAEDVDVYAIAVGLDPGRVSAGLVRPLLDDQRGLAVNAADPYVGVIGLHEQPEPAERPALAGLDRPHHDRDPAAVQDERDPVAYWVDPGLGHLHRA